jgi:hypothetical protein
MISGHGLEVGSGWIGPRQEFVDSALGTQRVQEMSVRAFRALGCEAMARVDFFLLADMRLVVNEVNTHDDGEPWSL